MVLVNKFAFFHFLAGPNAQITREIPPFFIYGECQIPEYKKSLSNRLNCVKTPFFAFLTVRNRWFYDVFRFLNLPGEEIQAVDVKY